uniref:Uncharacterized protein n=1 Tax=Solanum tuberosum TaxID=4113 RepID=M1CX47_SOLTU
MRLPDRRWSDHKHLEVIKMPRKKCSSNSPENTSIYFSQHQKINTVYNKLTQTQKSTVRWKNCEAYKLAQNQQITTRCE